MAPVPISESGQKDREQAYLETVQVAFTSRSRTESPAIPQDSWVESELIDRGRRSQQES